jgi:UrcA family protein
MKSLHICFAATFIAASFATGASADPSRMEDPIAVQQISYADLDLSSLAGQNRLKQRISFAAYGLCLVDPGASPSPAFADPGCFKRAMDSGLSQMRRVVAAAENHHMLAAAMPQHE